MMSFVGCKDYDDDINDLRNQIDDLKTGQIARMDEQIASIRATLEDLKNADESIRQAVTDLQNKTAQLEEADKALELLIDGKFTELQNSLNELESRVAANEAGIGDLKAWADKTDKWVEELENDLYDPEEGWFAILTGNDQVLVNNDKILEGLINDLKAALDSVRNAHGTDMAALAARITELQTALGGLSDGLDEFRSEIRGEIVRIDGQISDLRGELTEALREQIAALENMVSENYVNNTTFEEFTRQTLQRMQELTEAIDRINAIVPTLATKEELNALRDEIAGWLGDYVKKEIFEQVTAGLSQRLTDEIAALNGRIDALREQGEEHGARITVLEGNVASLTADLQALREEFETFRTDIRNEISAALEELQGQISEEISAAIAEAVGSINARMDDIEERLAGLEIDVAALIDRIQSLVYVPDYNDGKISVEAVADVNAFLAAVKRTVTRFEVRPATAAAEIAAAWASDRSVLEFRTVDVNTRSASETGCELVIGDVSAAADGMLTVTSDLTNYNPDFFTSRTVSYSVSLVLQNVAGGNVRNDMQSPYVNMTMTVNMDERVNFVPAREDEQGNLTLVGADPADYDGRAVLAALPGYDFPYNDLETVYALTGNMVTAVWWQGRLMTGEQFEAEVGKFHTYPSIEYKASGSWNPADGYLAEPGDWNDVKDVFSFDRDASTLKLAESDPAYVGKGAAIEYGLGADPSDGGPKRWNYVMRFFSQVVPVPTQAVLAPATRYWHYPEDVTATVGAGADGYSVTTAVESEQLQGNSWTDILAVTPKIYLVDDSGETPVETPVSNVSITKAGADFTVTFAGAAGFEWNRTYNIKAVYALPSSEVTVYATVTAVKPTAVAASVTAPEPIEWQYGREEDYTVTLENAVGALWKGAPEGAAMNNHFADASAFGAALEALPAAAAMCSYNETPLAAPSAAPWMHLDGPGAVILLNNGDIAERNVFVNVYDLDGIEVALTGSVDMELPVYTVQNNSIKLDDMPAADGYSGYWAKLAGRYNPDRYVLEQFTLENADLYECFIVRDAQGNIVSKADMPALGLGISFGMAPVQGVSIDPDGIMTYMSQAPYATVTPSLVLDGQPGAYADAFAAYAPFRVYPTNPIATSVSYVEGNNDIDVSTVALGAALDIDVWKTITLKDTRGFELFDPSAATFAEYSATVTGDGSNGFASGVTAAAAYQGLTVQLSSNVKAYRYINDQKDDQLAGIGLAGLSFDPATGVLTYTNNNVVNTSDVLVEIPVSFTHSWGVVTTDNSPIRVIVRR